MSDAQDRAILSEIVKATRSVAHRNISKAVARVREILSAPVEPDPVPEPDPEKAERRDESGRDRSAKGGRDRGIIG